MISCIMPTLARPHLVEQSIRMFELQTYQNRTLLVIDTGNQMPPTIGDRWRIVPDDCVPYSQGCLINRAIRDLPGTLIARWDDDDQYFPWHLEACVEALAYRPWAVPSRVWDCFADATIMSQTCRSGDGRDASYAACWSFTKEAWKKVGGYPEEDESEGECDFRLKLWAAFGAPADTISDRFPMPSYCYSRVRSPDVHDSTHTREERIARRRKEYPKHPAVTIRWPDNYMLGFPLNPVLSQRRW